MVNHWRAVIAALLLLLPNNLLVAQTDEAVITIVVPIPPATPAAELFLTRVITSFQAENVTVFVVDGDPIALAANLPADQRPVIELMLDVSPGASTFSPRLNVHDVGSPLPSPILKGTPDGATMIVPVFNADTVTADTSTPAVDYIVGIGLALLGECSGALAYFEQAGGASVTDPAIDFYLGNCLLRRGDLNAARARYERILRISDWAASAHINLAWTYFQLGRQSDALGLMNALVEASAGPARVDALLARSQLRSLAQQYDAAIADMNAALALQPASPALYTERAERTLLISQWDRALDDYNRALALDPAYAPAYFGRGLLFYSQGPLENAIADLQRYLELAPGGPHASDAAHYIEAIQAELQALGEEN